MSLGSRKAGLAMTRNLPQFVRDLVTSPPPRGRGLNNWFFRVARVLHPYRSEHEINALLHAAVAGESVKQGEIERAVQRSKGAAWKPGKPCKRIAAIWPSVNRERVAAVTSGGPGVVDLWEASPMRLSDNDPHGEEIIDRLFPGNPLLCAGRSNSDFATRPRAAWRGKLAEMQLIVPSPMTARFGITQEGKQSEDRKSVV